MPHKHLLFPSEAREKVLRGATAIADAVRVTLGPRSKCVLIEKKWGKPIVCNDGVTIAKKFALKDPAENLGAQMLRGAAERTGDAVGDGTTTSTLLAHAIVADGMRNIAAGASAIDLKRGLDRAARVAIDALRAQSCPVQSQREKEQVATISAHNDPTLGELVARAIEKVGAEGAVTVEEAKGTETTMDVVEGLQFDRGYFSPYFVTDPEKMEAVLEDLHTVANEQRLQLDAQFDVRLATWIGLHLPVHVRWRELTVVVLAASSGFTFTLFLATTLYPAGPLVAELKLGALSTVAGVLLALAAAQLLRVGRFAHRRRPRANVVAHRREA